MTLYVCHIVWSYGVLYIYVMSCIGLPLLNFDSVAAMYTRKYATPATCSRQFNTHTVRHTALPGTTGWYRSTGWYLQHECVCTRQPQAGGCQGHRGTASANANAEFIGNSVLWANGPSCLAMGRPSVEGRVVGRLGPLVLYYYSNCSRYPSSY